MLALHTWTLDTTPLAEVLRVARRVGWDGIELRRVDFARAAEQGQSAADVLALVRTSGLPVACVGVELGWMYAEGAERRRLLQVFDEQCQRAAALGCATVMSPVDKGHGDLRRAAESVREVGEVAAKHGVRLAVEFNSQAEQLNTLGRMREVMATAGHPRCGLLLDAYHLWRSGATVRDVEDVRRDEVVYVQFSDVPASVEPGKATDRLPPGRGVVPFKEFFARVEAAGYRGFMSYEAPNPAAWARPAGAVRGPWGHRCVADEVAYSLARSDARAVFVSDALLGTVERVRPGAGKVRSWILVGSERRPWAEHVDDLLKTGDPAPLPADPAQGLGGSMIYTGGTTGRPKGALRAATDPTVTRRYMELFGLAEPHVHLVAGPLYHSPPGSFAQFTHAFGGTVVVMRKFDPEDALRTIERHRCTSTFMAPTLVKRIVDLPERVRARYDVASMRVLVIAAAPCPTRVKEQAVAVFGPALWEFYGSTELGINTILPPADVLRKPGSCGRAAPGIELVLLDDAGRPVPTGTAGEPYGRRFPGMLDGHHKGSAATRASQRGQSASG